MEHIPALEQLRAAVGVIERYCAYTPQVGIILGSGMGALTDAITDRQVISYADIPHFPVSTVSGHAGALVMGSLAGRYVAILQGRAHYYEGYSMQQITLPVRVLRLLGVHTLIVTNAAGALNSAFAPGDLMVIRDHINLVGMAGANPLRGPNLDELGPRFPDMSHAYDPDLCTLARNVAQKRAIPLHEGVYVCVAGPSFETPAEVRFLRLIGGDAVGMSTAPEVTVARHAGMRVLGVSGISNVAIDQPASERVTSHDEVLEAAKIIVPRLTELIRGVLGELPLP
ncbi:MAG: purine-nucleoside phosphorylase [Ardenticatenia bacterium]|jgi:purine-nucleoside phosphorylase|nr:MAG: purine-nucleoside phosphorylase [Ardenticatenia bacterium]